MKHLYRAFPRPIPARTNSSLRVGCSIAPNSEVLIVGCDFSKPNTVRIVSGQRECDLARTFLDMNDSLRQKLAHAIAALSVNEESLSVGIATPIDTPNPSSLSA